MAEIELGPLTDRLSDDEIKELAAHMEQLGAPQMPHGDDTQVAPVGEGVDDNVLTEFFERLDSHDCAAEIYLPVEFEGSIEVGQLRVASAPFLLDVLDEIKDELDVEAEDEDEEDYDEDRRILDAQLRVAWKLFYNGATAAMERHLPLHIKA